MAHEHASNQGYRYDEPEHFSLERHKAGLIAAWAIGLVVVLSAIGMLVSRLHS